MKKVSNTTPEKQERLRKYFNISVEKFEEWMKDDVKRSMINLMAEGL